MRRRRSRTSRTCSALTCRSLELDVSNPRVGDGAGPGRTGNRIAVANIRERLALAYAGEASLEAGEDGDRFVVRVRLPLRESAPAATILEGGDA